MKLAALALAFLLVATAGCSSKPRDEAEPQEEPPPAEAGPLAIEAQGRVLVSPAGHRIAEFTAARDPNDPEHLAAAAIDYDDGSGMTACVTYHSSDAGRQWRQGAPVPGLDRPYLRFDPWVAIDAEGATHVVCIPEQSQVGLPASNGVYYSRSPDRGLTWSPARRVPTVDPAQRVDKVAMTTTRNGTVVACFGESGQGLVIARSFDRGQTWAPTVPADVPGGLCAAVIEGGQGRLHIAFTGGGNVRLATSVDGGTRWESVDVGPYEIYPYYNNAYRVVTPYPMTTTPSAALSGASGTIAVAVQTWDGAAERWKVQLHTSTDAGATFAPLSTPPFAPDGCGKCHAIHPLVAFDEAGRLGLQVTFVSDGGIDRRVQFASSNDEGRTWSDPVLLSSTGMDASYAQPGAWTRDPAAVANLADYIARNPDDAVHTATWVAATAALVEPMQMRWGGEYWGMVGLVDGFAPFWLEFSGDGEPQLWSGRIGVAGASAN